MLASAIQVTAKCNTRLLEQVLALGPGTIESGELKIGIGDHRPHRFCFRFANGRMLTKVLLCEDPRDEANNRHIDH